MKRPKHVFLAAVLTTAVVVSSCGSDDPARVGRPPVVKSYAPESRELSRMVGDTLEFRISAFDPDRDPLTTRYEINGSPAANTANWDFAVVDTGLFVVRGSVRDGEHESFIEWRLTAEKPVNLPPVIVAVEPVEASPTLIIGNRLDFAVLASDPENAKLAYTFTVNDSLVSTERQFSYLAASVGTKRVRATVSDGEHQVARDWQLKVTNIPDTFPPAEVEITFVAPGDEPGTVDLEWVAVGRDGMVGLPSEYEVRTSPEPILTEADWLSASDRPGVPDPAPPGETMRMTLTGLLPARSTYVAVRASDDFGNESPIGEPVVVTTRGMRFGGFVRDARTGVGLVDAVVTFGVGEARTDAEGRYQFEELGPGEGTLAARDETGAAVGAYFDYDLPYTVQHDDEVDFYLLPNYPMQSPNYTDFLQFYRTMTDIAGSPYYAQQRRWALPINLYVRPYTREGLDYKATVERVAQEFDAIIGTQVFNLVSTAPAEGVQVAYNDQIARDRYTVTEWTSDWYPRVGLVEFRTVYTPSTVGVLEVTARHEFGHAIGLNHSSDFSHLMVGGPAPSAQFFTSDEVALIRCLYHIPRGWDNRRYQRN